MRDQTSGHCCSEVLHNICLILSHCREINVNFVGIDFTLQLDIKRKLTEFVNTSNQILNVK
jgi:hypothetical protein